MNVISDWTDRTILRLISSLHPILVQRRSRWDPEFVTDKSSLELGTGPSQSDYKKGIFMASCNEEAFEIRPSSCKVY
jgi:hypothetical protein